MPTKPPKTTLIILGYETRIIPSCRFVFLVNIFATKMLIINISG